MIRWDRFTLPCIQAWVFFWFCLNIKISISSGMRKCAFGTYAKSEGPDQTAHPRSLVWTFNVCLQKIEYCRMYRCITEVTMYRCITKVTMYRCITKVTMYWCITKVKMYWCITKVTMCRCITKVTMYRCISKVLIKLCSLAGWSASLLFLYVPKTNYFLVRPFPKDSQR